MAEHIHDDKCLPYDKLNSMQRMLVDEGCSSLLGLQHKLLAQKRIASTQLNWNLDKSGQQKT